MTPREALEDAVAFAQELIDGAGDNPQFFEAWRTTQALWQGHLDRGELSQGLSAAREKVRAIGVEAGDWEEHTGSVYGGPTPYGGMSAQCFRRLKLWREAHA